MLRRVVVIVLLMFVFGSITTVYSQDLESVRSMNQSALQSYDMMDYQGAEGIIDEAIAAVERVGIDDALICSQIFATKGIILYGLYQDSGEKEDYKNRGVEAFSRALRYDWEVVIPEMYRSAAVEAWLASAKEKLLAEEAQKASRSKVQLNHVIISESPRCKPLVIDVKVPEDPNIYRVVLQYRLKGEEKFHQKEMNPNLKDVTEFSVELSPFETDGEGVDYYIEAYNRQQERVSELGNLENPYFCKLVGQCVREKKIADASLDLDKWGDPLMQIDLRFGGGFGTSSKEARRYVRYGAEVAESPGARKIDAGVSPIPFFTKLYILFNIGKWVQLGGYGRFQVIAFDWMAGLSFRLNAVHSMPHRMFVGLDGGYGLANSIIQFDAGRHNEGSGSATWRLYRHEGVAHIAPHIGYSYYFAKYVGVSFQLAVPIHFPKPSAHFDFDFGFVFQF